MGIKKSSKKKIILSVDIYIYRKKFIDTINLRVKKIYFDLTGYNNLIIQYTTTPLIKEFSKKELKAQLENDILNIGEKEINYRKTLSGPHLDDFVFILDDMDLRNYGSQGQQRSAVLSLKLSEIDIFKKEKKEYPVLLLDDVLSELDEINKNNLIKYINGNTQTIITTTNIKNLDKKLLKNSNIYIVNNDKVLKIDEVKANE